METARRQRAYSREMRQIFQNANASLGLSSLGQAPAGGALGLPEAVKAAAAAIGAGAGYFLGGWDGFLYGLAAMAALDCLTGAASAAVHKSLSSRAWAGGIARKAMIFMLVGAAHTLDAYILGNHGGAIRTAVIFFFVGNEGISILENAASAGLPVPPALKGALLRARGGGEAQGQGWEGQPGQPGGQGQPPRQGQGGPGGEGGPL